MGRFPQRPCKKGSQRWIQWFVNQSVAVLNESIGLGPINWRSPLAKDDYAEYRDSAFLTLLGVGEQCALDAFWPRGGPQWDALGMSEDGVAVLVEAKAHLNELYSPPSMAGEQSLELIQTSLAQAAAALGVRPGYDWSKQFYQYANRLAHGYFLNTSGIEAKVVFLYFVGDSDVHGPATRSEWETAVTVVQSALGLTAEPSFVVDAFIDVRPHRLLLQQSDPVVH